MTLQEKFDPLFAGIPDSCLMDHTFFDIGGYGFYENISSNILAFYLNNHSKYHVFGDPLLRSLLLAAGCEEFISDPLPAVTILREVATETGRIDLVLYTPGWVVAIENKIRHSLHGNDLEEYSRYIDKRFPGKKTRKIVLSVKDENVNMKGGFTNLTYKQLLQKADEVLAKNPIPVKDKYSVFFYEFIQSFRNMYQPVKMEKEEITFLLQNRDKIRELLELENRFDNYVKQRCEMIKDSIRTGPGITKWVYDMYDVGFHYQHGNIQYKLECLLLKTGIEIIICVEPNLVDIAAIEKLKLAERLGKTNWRYSHNNTRLVIEDNIDLQIPDEELIKKLQLFVDDLVVADTQPVN